MDFLIDPHYKIVVGDNIQQFSYFHCCTAKVSAGGRGWGRKLSEIIMPKAGERELLAGIPVGNRELPDGAPSGW